MYLPIGMIDKVKDGMKGQYPLSFMVFTHEGLRFHQTRAKFQLYKGEPFIKLFSNKQSYAAPDLKFSIIQGALKVDAKAWEGSKIESKGSTVYFVYAPSEHELSPIDIRGTKSKEAYLNFESAEKRYAQAVSFYNKKVSMLPRFSVDEKWSDEEKKAKLEEFNSFVTANLELEKKELEDSSKELSESKLRLKAICIRDNVFFAPQLSASATQTVIRGFNAIAQYMKDKTQENLMILQAVGVIFVVIGVVIVAYLYFDQSGKLATLSFDSSVKMAQALPSYIQECARQGYINLTNIPKV